MGVHIPVTAVMSDLSVGQQQMVEICKALMVDAKVLIMDEPTAALTQSETEILSNRDEADLILVSRAYLLPYLRFIRDNRRVYRAAFRNPDDMGAYVRYGELKQRVLSPLLERFRIPAAYRPYYIAYYVEGIIAVVKEWLRQDCADEVEMIANIIETCVHPGSGRGA